MDLAWPLAQFAVCALLVARAGYALSRSADTLALQPGDALFAQIKGVALM